MKVWKDIPGYEGLYKVSNDGEVYSIRRNIVLSPKIDRYGYRVVCLRNGKNNHIPIHRLVAKAFLPPKEGCNVVNHIDSNKENNTVDNLEWTTVQGNTKHAYDNNALYRQHMAKVNKMGIEARKIKLDAFFNEEYVGTFNSKKEAADKLGISEKTVYNRLHNRFSSKSGYTFVQKAVR